MSNPDSKRFTAIETFSSIGDEAARSRSSREIGAETRRSLLPKRIILVRHGESQGSTDRTIYGLKADYRIPLTSIGSKQSEQAGSKIFDLVSDYGNCYNWKVVFYVSPYERSRSTMREIGRPFSKDRVIGVREESRLREQDLGNFQDYEKMKDLKEIRRKFGRFFYRFPEGESGADVYDRVSSFLESLWRDIDMRRLSDNPSNELNIVIVSHGLAIRIFLMKWFKWTVEQFESLKSPKHCEIRVMQLGSTGEYSLGIHQDAETLEAWGLSPEMIEDQFLKANADGLCEKSPMCFDAFFDHLADSEDSCEEDYETK